MRICRPAAACCFAGVIECSDVIKANVALQSLLAAFEHCSNDKWQSCKQPFLTGNCTSSAGTDHSGFLRLQNIGNTWLRIVTNDHRSVCPFSHCSRGFTRWCKRPCTICMHAHDHAGHTHEMLQATECTHRLAIHIFAKCVMQLWAKHTPSTLHPALPHFAMARKNIP